MLTKINLFEFTKRLTLSRNVEPTAITQRRVQSLQAAGTIDILESDQFTEKDMVARAIVEIENVAVSAIITPTPHISQLLDTLADLKYLEMNLLEN